ncbi:F-box/RNI-like/FBD-like domains-containing protein, partial [Striga asiatica]
MEKTKQPSGKRQMLSIREQNMGSIDRLSSLQDDVICHILSFLPTKLSVATCVLGKRWRFLWAHVPCLDFSGDNFKKKRTQASDIINRVIFLHKAKRMHTLTLRNLKCNDYQLETWIMTAIERSIQNLYLQLEFNTIPQSLFNCKTIVDLKLDNNRAPLSDVDNVSLPSLKKFNVSNVVCENDDALPRFLSGCPLLEELIMKFKFVEKDDYVGCITISSPTIKMLMLDLHGLTSPSNLKYRMIINAPALRYLIVDGYDLECITIPITMISLVEADIRLTYHCFSNLKTTVVKFFHSLCFVKCLKISCWEFEEETRQSSEKRPKLSDGEENMASIDRLSSLPDDVICHILSFLPTKLSMATSVLRKRWRFLWAHVPCLHFIGLAWSEWTNFLAISRVLILPCSYIRGVDFTEDGTQINGVILRHKAKRLDTLKIDYVNCNEHQLETLITTTIDRNIRNLYLQLKSDAIPQSLFISKTIVDLKLGFSTVSLSAVDNVSLPSLKKFHVSNLVCENDDALPHFLSGCPSLEELNLAFAICYDYVGCITISSPTIKTLKLDLYRLCCPDSRMIINAPALRYLQVYGYDLECITIPITMISLVEADISLKYFRFPNLKPSDNSLKQVANFLLSLSYVKCLKISRVKFGE